MSVLLHTTSEVINSVAYLYALAVVGRSPTQEDGTESANLLNRYVAELAGAKVLPPAIARGGRADKIRTIATSLREWLAETDAFSCAGGRERGRELAVRLLVEHGLGKQEVQTLLRAAVSDLR